MDLKAEQSHNALQLRVKEMERKSGQVNRGQEMYNDLKVQKTAPNCHGISSDESENAFCWLFAHDMF